MIVDCNDFWAILYYEKCQNLYCPRTHTFEKKKGGGGGVWDVEVENKPLVVGSS